MRKPRSLFKTVRSISLATGVSRVLGLGREMVQAAYFGASPLTDAYIAAFRIPNLLRDLFAEGALSSAFVPTFTAEKERHGKEAAWRLANRLLSVLMVVVGAVCLGIIVFAPSILEVFAPGFDDAKRDLAVTMTRILGPFLLFVAMAAVAMGMLNSLGKFFVPALAPAFFNLAFIVGVVTLVPVLRGMGIPPVLSLAIGAITGGLLQFLVQVPLLHKKGFRFRPEWKLSDPGLRRIARLMLPAAFGLAATQINILVDTVLASYQGDGAISWLSYAFRLMQLPIGLFGVAIATANLARVSHDVVRGDPESLRANLAGSMRMAALLTLPATAGLVALRVPIVRVLFERGEFGVQDTSATAAAVVCYALGLFAYSVVKIQVPTFYALGDARRPVVASAVTVTVKIAVSLVLLAHLGRFGVAPFLGLALATSFASWSNFVQLTVGLRRHVGSLRGRGIGSTVVKAGLLSVAMGAVCHWLHRALETHVGGGASAGEILRLGIAVGVGMAITAVGWRVLGVPEGRELWSRFTRKPGPSRGRPESET